MCSSSYIFVLKVIDLMTCLRSSVRIYVFRNYWYHNKYDILSYARNNWYQSISTSQQLYSCCIKRKVRSLCTKSINKAFSSSVLMDVGRTMLNSYVLSLLLFCLGFTSLLYIKLSFYKYCSYCQVPLTSILGVITIGIRAY